jgi:DNA-binding LacI/PurR family transcriptional regulator
MSSERPVTIKDVAREAGVTPAAVSMALRGNPRISAAMRGKISSLAKSMGYRRNPAFAILGAMSHRHAASREGLPIAFVHQLETNGENRRNSLLMSGISRTSEKLGYRLEEHLVADFAHMHKLAKSLKARNVSGVILGNITDPALLEALPLSRMALVAAGAYRTLLPVHTVRGSRFQAGEQTILHLLSLGYRKILVLVLWHLPEPLEEDYARYGGVAAAAKHRNLRGGWIRIVDRPYDAGDKSVRAWREIIHRENPEVVVGFNSADIHQVWPRAIRSPGAPAFAAVEVMDIHLPRVSGMIEHDVEIGEASVEWLDQLIRLTQFGLPAIPRSLLIETEWNPGETAPEVIRRK